MDGPPPEEEDFSKIPLSDRVDHKNWKARVSAYTEIASKAAKTASDTDAFFRPYISEGPLLRKWCVDANAAAQEKGVEAVLAIVQYSGESSSRTRSDVVPGLVEKCFSAMRAGTKKNAVELCLMYVEVENGAEGVISDILVGLDAKQPKTVAGSITCLKEIVEAFGLSAIGNVKPVLKALPRIFAHTDKTVRSEGSALVLALYAYLGAAIQPALADLKPVQVSDLQKQFDALDAEGKGAGTGKATRYTRQAQQQRESAPAAGANGGEEDSIEPAVEANAIDPRSLLDPVNVFAKFPSDLDERLASSKWKDRLESLEECNKALADPKNARISDDNVDAYGPLMSTLGPKIKSDANINVVIEAARVIEGLARGLGKPFGRYRPVVMPPCLDRLKERKATVVEAIGKALDAVFETVHFGEIVEDTLAACASKNPQVKEGTLKFLHRSLQNTTEAPGKDHVKPTATTLVTLLGDSAEPVRSAAAECLGTMMKILGERAFNPYIEGVGDIQMGKVKDAFARAEIRYKAGGAKAAPTPAARPAPAVVKKVAPGPPAAASAPASVPKAAGPPAGSSFPGASIKSTGAYNLDDLDTQMDAPKRAPPARFAKPAQPKPTSPTKSTVAPAASAPTPARKAATAPAAAAAGPSKPAAVAKAGPSKQLAVSPSEPIKYRFTPEDAAAQAVERIPADFHTKLADAAWKTRLEAGEELVKFVDEEGGAEKVESEVMFRFLGKTPGWNEKNFQVSAKVYQVMQLMAEKSPSFGRASAALAIGHLTDKLGDLKLKKPSGDALTAFAEKTSLAFVLAQGYEPMTKQKAPKAQADALLWIKQQLIEFGIAGITLRDLIGFVKTGLGSPNALVRQSATQVLVTVKIAVGADISGFLEDLNPQLLTTINSEFDKAASQSAPEPTRQQADLKEAVASGKGGAAKGGADPLDDLIPRQDLDKLVGQTSILTDSRSDAWKVRKEAFEALNALLEVKSNQRLKPTMGEISSVLKRAMADTNLAVKMLALGMIGKIATGMGQPFDKYNRMLVAPVCSVCADQKSTTRQAALTALSGMADASGGLDTMFAGLATSLESTNPLLRSSVLGWTGERLQVEAPGPNADLSPMAAPVLSCLEDRNGDVRKAAGIVLPFVVASAGYEFVMDKTSGLKPASRSTIIPLIDKARSSGPSGPVKTAAPIVGSKTPAAKPKPAPVVAAAARTDSPGPSSRAGPSAARVASPARPALAKPAAAAPQRSLAMKALSNIPAPAARPPSAASSDDRPSGLGLKRPKVVGNPARPGSSAASSVSSPKIGMREMPFITQDPNARAQRLKKDTNKWLLDVVSKSDLTDYLAGQMDIQMSPDIFAQLFSKDHRAEEDFMAGLSTLADFYVDSAGPGFGLSEKELRNVQMTNVDLALKYAALKLLSNNTQLTNRCLELVQNILDLMPKYGERFSDAEAKLFVPALIAKLGDSKFTARLTPIFEALDRVIAGSQVVQLLVQYGLEDKTAGKSCKNEVLQLIERAYRKRGSILRTKDDKGFYDSLVRCTTDPGTRSAALGVLALLQIQGGSPSLAAVIDGMPQASKDMLANRRMAMAGQKINVPVAKVAAAGTESSSPARTRTSSPVSNRAADEVPAGASPSRPSKNASSGISSSAASGLPRAGAAGLPIQNRLVRPTEAPKPRQPLPDHEADGEEVVPSARVASNTLRPAASSSRPAMQPLRGAASRSIGTGNGSSTPAPDRVLAAINAIHDADPSRSVDALKVIQEMLDVESDSFTSSAGTLLDALLDEMDSAYTPIANLENPTIFRLVKHLLQTISEVTNDQRLMSSLGHDSLYSLMRGITWHMVQSERAGGNIQLMNKFMNNIVLKAMAMGDRHLVLKVMYSLLLDLSKDFRRKKVRANSEQGEHADLVIKALWKRAKLLEDDYKTGRVKPGPMLRILEDFLQAAPPIEWRQRETENIALGSYPLRTIKGAIQRLIVFAQESGADMYEILLNEFGDAAAETIVYTYIFRLQTSEDVQAVPSSSASASTSVSRPRSAASISSATQRVAPSSTTASAPRIESEAERLVRAVKTGAAGQDRLDAIYAYLRGNSAREAEIQAAVGSLLTDTLQRYVLRMIDQRKADENGGASGASANGGGAAGVSRAGVGAGLGSPPARRPEGVSGVSRIPSSSATAARRSLAPRQSTLPPLDKSAPIDDQLAQLKHVFARGGAIGSSQSGGIAGAVGRGEEPLRERAAPNADSSVD